MKNIILLILFFTISIFTSCATCEERPDSYSYLNNFDKSILHFSSDTELKFLKNHTQVITFKISKTINEFDNLRASDDEICYADFCEIEITKIEIPNTKFMINFVIENQMGYFLHYLSIENIDNYEEFFNYKLLNQNDNSILNRYNQNTSFFNPLLQDININNKQYNDVLVYVDVENSNKFLIIKPSEGLIYFDFKNDSYELIK